MAIINGVTLTSQAFETAFPVLVPTCYPGVAPAVVEHDFYLLVLRSKMSGLLISGHAHNIISLDLRGTGGLWKRVSLPAIGRG